MVIMRQYSIVLFVIMTMAICIDACAYHDLLQRMERERIALRSKLNAAAARSNVESEHHHHPAAPLQGNTHAVRIQRSHQFRTVPLSSSYRRVVHSGGVRYPVREERVYYHRSSSDDNVNENVYIPAVNRQSYVSCPNSNTHVCLRGSVCVFEYGVYRCRTTSPRTTRRYRYQYRGWPYSGSRFLPGGKCNHGYKRVNVTSANSYNCVDIDECADEESNRCEQKCRNTNGAYQCECNQGYRMHHSGTCIDVNECSNRYNRCQHQCINTNGSFDCQCPEGYTKNVTTLRCHDIDECSEEGTCSDDERCLNTFGGHQCNLPEPCDDGYLRANATSDEFGPCILTGRITRDRGRSRAPYSISYNRFSLYNNYRQQITVGTIKYTRIPGHYYTFKVTEGSGYFSVGGYHSNTITIRTKHRLIGPFTYTMKILITDYDNTPRHNYYYHPYDRITTSRVDFEFVVSAYSF